MKIKFVIAATLCILVASFQNCMGGSTHSNGEGSLEKSCENALRRLFADTYHPFLTTNCSNCHRDQSGPENGTGKWAQNDLNRAYAEFAGATRTRVRNRILDDDHKSPLTGTHNQGFVDAHEARWKYFEAEAESCRTGAHFSTVTKLLSGTPDADGFYTMEWDLFTEVRRESLRQKIHVIVRIKVKPGMVGASPSYEFSQPTARLRSGSPGNFSLGGIQIERNGELVTDFTTWLYLNAPNVTSTTATLLHTAGDGFAVVPATAMSDQFALKISWVKDRNGVEL